MSFAYDYQGWPDQFLAKVTPNGDSGTSQLWTDQSSYGRGASYAPPGSDARLHMVPVLLGGMSGGASSRSDYVAGILADAGVLGHLLDAITGRRGDADVAQTDASPGEPIDRIRIEHAVDADPPAFFGLDHPSAVIAPRETELGGYAYDDSGVARIDVQSAAQMREAVLRQLPADVFIAVAAVADYRPAAPDEHKIKKGTGNLTLELTANPDILAEVAARPDAPFCVGFAAESRDLATYAEGKRQAKKLPLVVGNLVQDGMGGDANVVTLFDAAGAHPLPPGDKLAVARQIVSHIANLLEK